MAEITTDSEPGRAPNLGELLSRRKNSNHYEVTVTSNRERNVVNIGRASGLTLELLATRRRAGKRNYRHRCRDTDTPSMIAISWQ